MFDFHRLMNRTPEEKAADEAEQAANSQALLDRLSKLVETRDAWIDALMDDGVRERLGDWDAKFTRDLHYLSTTYDIDGKLGGKLAFLSDKQVEQLNRLVAKYLPRPVVAQAQSPQVPPEVFDAEQESAEQRPVSPFASFVSRPRG